MEEKTGILTTTTSGDEDHDTATNNELFAGHPSRRRPPIPGLNCQEFLRDDDDLGKIIMFQCQLPNDDIALEFNCRDSSTGVLHPELEEQHVPVEEKLVGQVDHNFFDQGYTLAGSTGFQIWPGTRLMTEALGWPLEEDDCDELTDLQGRISNCNVLEIGAGIGVVGVALAAMGANVLQTDLPTLTDNAIYPNQLLNHQRKSTATTKISPGRPAFLESYKDAVPIGKGWAAATALDWTQPLETQIPISVLSQIDMVVGCDCLWLKHMEEPLLTKIQRIFELTNSNTRFLVTYQRRGRNSMFSTLETVLDSFKTKYQWDYDCLAWRSINCAKEGDAPEDGANDLFLLKIAPSKNYE